MTNQKTLLTRLTCALYLEICLSVLDCGKPQIVSHESDTVRHKSFSWARDYAQNREKLPYILECFYYPPLFHMMDAVHF